MNKSKNLLISSVLYTDLCFQLLDFFEDSYEKGDTRAITLMNDFFKKKDYTYDLIKPLMRLPTSLGILASIIFFIKNKDISLSEETMGQIKYSENIEILENNHCKIIQTIRNALAHWSDHKALTI